MMAKGAGLLDRQNPSKLTAFKASDNPFEKKKYLTYLK